MKTTSKNLYLSLLVSSAIMFSPTYADAKTIIWPDDSSSSDPEAKLRTTPMNGTINSLFISSNLDGNTLTVNSGDINGSVYAAYATGSNNATNNVLNINGGTIGIGFSPSFSNGYAAAGNSQDGDSTNNTTNMTGGSVTRGLYGGVSAFGHANNNVVNMTGGSITTSVGTAAIAGGYVSNTGSSSAASNNTVNISGGSINGDIYGGDSLNGIDANNTVNISGNVTITATSSIYGGNSLNGNITHPNNTLNLAWAGTISRLGSFEHINFTVNDAVINNNNTALNITTSANINGSNIKIIAFENTTPLNIGDKITLLSRSSGNAANLYGGSVQQGLAKYFNYDINYENGTDNSVVMSITDSGINKDVGDIPSGNGATSSLLKSGADLLNSAALVDEVDGQAKLIGIVKHSRSKIGSNSGFNVNGTNMLLGTSKKFDGNKGYVMLGGFVEAGWGNFDTHSNFSDGAEILSSGKSSYHGAGIAMSNIRDNGIYSRFSVRLGRASTQYKSSNLTDSSNSAASYDTNSLYYGANISLGKVIKLDNSNSLDIYGKYQFLHQNGSTITISGDTFDLKPIDSHRIRVGTKLNNNSNKNINTYIDLAYEYEFAGQSKAVTYGVELPYVSTKGGTAIAELGIVYKPKNMDKFETRLGIQGYVGKRQGMSGNIEFKWKF